MEDSPIDAKTKRDADAFLATTTTDIERGTWIPPEQSHSRTAPRRYSQRWLEQKFDLRPRSRERYEINLRRHILRSLGDRDR